MKNINYSEVVNLVEKDIELNGPADRFSVFCLLIAKYGEIDSAAIMIVNKLYCDGFIKK